MVQCECGKTFKNKAGLGSHQKWCDGTGLNIERTKEKVETERICEYGCGEKANWRLKNDNLCCSEYPSQCSEIRNKNSEGVKEAWEDDPWYTGDDTGGGWNEGKKYEDVMGKKDAYEYKKKISKSLKENSNVTGRASTKEKEKERRRKLSKNAGGYRKGGGRSNGCWYESPTAGEVWLDSSYELAYAKWLDENKIKWERNTEKFGYLYEGDEKNYIPDFYLVDEDKYIEIKGFETEKDRAKWRDFPHEIEVLKKEDLLEMGCDL